MKCHHHPAAPAVNRCGSCELPLCGVCVRYRRDTALCERCERQALLADRRDRETARPAQPGANLGELVREFEAWEDQQEKEASEREKKQPRRDGKLLKVGVLMACTVVIAAQLAYLSSRRPLSSAEILAQETRLNQIEECMLLFWDAAELLRQGRTPPNTLRCPGSDLPLQVSRNANGIVTVRHPAPATLGLSEVFVTSIEPTPIVIE